jgi:hypothetical protein
MSSVDITQLPELVDSTAYPVMFEQYEAVPLVYPRLGRVVDPLSLSTPLYGHKEAVIEGFERFRKRSDGAPVEQSSMSSGYNWYLSCNVYSRSISIPDRMLRATDAKAKVENLIRKAAEGFGENARLQKEDHIADMFQKGTLTAGSTEFFDGSHPGNADPYRGFIYDNLPWFDTAHTLSGSSTTLSNHTPSGLSLTQANLQTVLTTMTSTNAVNERGERVSIRPTTLMVPPGLEFTAKTILGSLQASGSANNDINPIAGALEPIVNRALDDSASTSAWWVGQAGRGLVIADSGAPRVRVVIHPNGDAEVIFEYDFGAGVDNWRYWYCANKAAA